MDSGPQRKGIRLQFGDETKGGPHRPHGVRARWPNADLEEFKETMLQGVAFLPGDNAHLTTKVDGLPCSPQRTWAITIFSNAFNSMGH